jgi:exopolyphosphatase / guanosine-5'-triphosphate,3'-diphosphate pyrophosphatase
MKTIGIIDIGSNTIHLDIFRVTGGSIIKIASQGNVNTLGVCLSKGKIIPRTKIDEAGRIIQGLLQYAQSQNVDETVIFATSILRHAKNRTAFLKAVKKKCGKDIDIISGLSECACLEKAARYFSTLKNGPTLLVDIGGGSTEFVLFDKNRTYLRKSYSFGLSYVKGKYGINDIEAVPAKALERFFHAKIRLFLKGMVQYTLENIIVTSSVAKIMAGLKYGGRVNATDGQKKKIYFRDIIALQQTLTTDAKKVALDPKKKILVQIGTYFFAELLRALDKQFFSVATHSVREGYLLHYLHL